MTLMCIDIGNTNIVSGIYKNSQLVDIKRMDTNKNAIDKNIDFSTTDNIAISSVVPKIEEHIINHLSSTPFFSVSHTNSNIILNVDSPADVGNDRLCNIKNIIKKTQYPAIVVDFGSATTYDVINDNGEFIGGAIAPGIEVSSENLISKAALLNKVTYEIPKHAIGKNTLTNLQSGIVLGAIDSIHGMVKRIQKEIIENENLKIILTGGFSQIISPVIKFNHEINLDLTLMGINLIYFNEIKTK